MQRGRVAYGAEERSTSTSASIAGVVYGWVFASHQLGAAVAAFTAGAIRSTTGSYELAFHAAGALCVVTAGLVLLIRTGPRDRDLVPALD